MIHGGEYKNYKFTEEEAIAMAGVMEKFLQRRNSVILEKKILV